jgi:hypothetical protein
VTGARDETMIGAGLRGEGRCDAQRAGLP